MKRHWDPDFVGVPPGVPLVLDKVSGRYVPAPRPGSPGRAAAKAEPGQPGSSFAAASAAADRLLAQVKAAVGAGRPDPAAWCGRCVPCRNGSRSQCVHKGTAHAAACQAADAAEDRRGLAAAAPTLDEQLAELEAHLSAGWHAAVAERGRGWVWAG